MDTGKFEILGEVEKGGMGKVYKARHRSLNVVRALKKIRHLGASDLRLRERFQREAQIAAKLQHQNLAQVYDLEVEEDGTAYMVLEWIDGRTLLQMLGESGPPDLEFVLKIAQQALSALGYLHHKGIVHRDVSPDNLMVTGAGGDGPIVKLIDMGIAKEVDGGFGLTDPGVFVGKLPYAAPETVQPWGSMGKPDPRSDLYSFGVVLYELLTGERPVVGDSPSELAAGHLHRPPRPFNETDPSGRVPMELRAIVLKALEKNLGKRFQSAMDFARALSSLRPSPVGEERPERGSELREAWFSRLRKEVLPRPRGSSKRPASSLFEVVRTLPKPFAVVTSAALLVGLVSSLVLLSRSVEAPRALAELGADIEAGSAEPVEEPKESKPPEGDGSGPAQKVTAPAAVPSAGPAPLRVVLVADDAQLAATIQNHLDRRVGVEIRPSLWAVSTQDSATRLAIEASTSLRQFSVESYGVLLPSCEAAVTGRLVEIPRGRTFFARTITRTAPRCGEALDEAARLLSDVLAPQTLEFLRPGQDNATSS